MNRKQTPISVQLTVAQRKVVAEMLPTLADRLKLDKKNVRAIPFTPAELDTIRRKAERAFHCVESGMKRNSLRHIVDVTAKAIGEAPSDGLIPMAERLYQFKITLLDSQPPIWRRIQVKNCTLEKLHEHIQAAMGWNNCHLYQFEIGGKRYGDPELLDDGFGGFECVDSTVTKISEIVPKDGKRFRFLYEYDFGDGWEHEVVFEGCLRANKGQRYPVCLEGERACPPEDVGGVWGYAEFLNAITDPKHERHDEFVEWAGPFDPEDFDPAMATKAMRRV